jgi:TFIIH basal transcription factor complex TTD-A subunit
MKFLRRAWFKLFVLRNLTHMVRGKLFSILRKVLLSPNFHFSDAAVKQILLTLNDKHSFIIEDLDDFHIVIKADEEYWVRTALESEVR